MGESSKLRNPKIVIIHRVGALFILSLFPLVHYIVAATLHTYSYWVFFFDMLYLVCEEGRGGRSLKAGADG